MNEQQVSALIAALNEQVAAQKKQTEAITRLAESNESLSAAILQALSEDSDDIDVTELQDATPRYLSGKPR
ncbi:TPA: hypothetical protein ACK2W2_002281 [Klebsiella michiganensis]